MTTALPESAVRYWSMIMADRFFDSEQDARNAVFRICERHSQQSWSTPEGKVTIHENRAFANSLPLYREEDQWKVGRPLEEYLTMTPDFSDGTSGGRAGEMPSPGDAGTAVGLPDYKYLERKKRRHDKLRALMQRRDPDSSSTNPVDRQIQATLGEGRLSAEEMAILKRQTKPRRHRRFRLREDEDDDTEIHKDVGFHDEDEVVPYDVLEQHLHSLGYGVEHHGEALQITNPQTGHYLVADLENEDPEHLESFLFNIGDKARFEQYWQTLFGDVLEAEQVVV